MILPRELNHQRHFARLINEQNGAWQCLALKFRLHDSPSHLRRTVMLKIPILLGIKTIGYRVLWLRGSDDEDSSPCGYPVCCNTCLEGDMAITGVHFSEDLFGSQNLIGAQITEIAVWALRL